MGKVYYIPRFNFVGILFIKLRANGHNNSQQCWELLANNVASFCTGLKVSSVSNFAQQHATGCSNGRSM